MKIIRESEQERSGKRVLVLGTFDGVHRGHRRLLDIGKEYAAGHGLLLRACSFDRHPLEVLCPEKAPKLLTTVPEKTRLMDEYGADEMQLIPFTRETADMEPEVFLRFLRETVSLCAVIVGWNYTFGKGGKGNAEVLAEDGKKNGYKVLIVPPVKTEQGEIISSTLIRTRLLEGRTGEAERLLGHSYQLSGLVGEGKHVGHRIGIPTANVETEANKQLPAFGVYPCCLETGEQRLAAAVNIGMQPTIPSGRVTVEAHILDGEPNLYGQRVELTLGDRIRPERKFDSPEELTAQIRKDTETVRKWYDMG